MPFLLKVKSVKIVWVFFFFNLRNYFDFRFKYNLAGTAANKKNLQPCQKSSRAHVLHSGTG